METFTNQATLFYNDTATNSNTTVGELRGTIAVTKTAVVDTYQAGGTVTYVISIVNTGAAALDGLCLTDNLGEFIVSGERRFPLSYAAGSVQYYVNGTLQPDPMVLAGPPLVMRGIDIPAGGNALIIYSTDVTRFAPLSTGSTITNTVTVTRGRMATPVTAEETVTVAEEAVLTISKSLEPSIVSEGSRLTYTLVVQNSGNTAATTEDRVIITDRLNPALSDLVVTLNDTVLEERTDYTYVNGLFSTRLGVVTVPAATLSRNPFTGIWEVTPGVSVLTISGTV